MREKRQFTRITLNVPTILSLYQIQAYHTGSIANISKGGCFFSVGETLPVGEECQVTITVGEGLETEEITLLGQIVRSLSEEGVPRLQDLGLIGPYLGGQRRDILLTRDQWLEKAGAV